MNRAARRQSMRLLQKQTAHAMGLPKPKPTIGFGLTLTNKKIAVLIWTRVFTIWQRKVPA